MSRLVSLQEWFNFPTLIAISVDGTFLPDHPAALHKAGRLNKVDVMAGVTQDEGNLFSSGIVT